MLWGQVNVTQAFYRNEKHYQISGFSETSDVRVSPASCTARAYTSFALKSFLLVDSFLRLFFSAPIHQNAVTMLPIFIFRT